MNRTKLFILTLILASVFAVSCSVLNNPLKINDYALIHTDQGVFIIGLYEGTPLHKEIFLENICSGIYDSCLVYSIIPNGLMKAGLPEDITEEAILQENFTEKTIQPEINEKLINKTGAVGMLRLADEKNADRLSDTKLFYLVQGINLDEKTLKTLEAKRNAPIIADYLTIYLNKPENQIYKDSLDYYKIEGQNKNWSRLYADLTENIIPEIEKDGKKLFKINKYQTEMYQSIGGAPVYDGQYTVFGEIVEGIEIFQKFSEIKTGLNNKPKKNIYILSTEKLTKKEYKNLK
ncbi:MAG: peptidylprolyl isomerase [Bacteroidales bacterium]|nr:peptidylprolyl isomerase [Bacteroidales bacterium]MDD3858840.1 peptidylprolyl isomerase [Bacteroidales bacterium]